MAAPQPSIAQQIAEAATIFETERTGHAPDSVTVVMGGETVVITLHGTLSQAEKTLASTPVGAAQVQEFHRQLFADASASFRREMHRITGVQVREATAEVDGPTGTMLGVFTSGTAVQVFLMSQKVPAGAWNSNDATIV